MAAAGNTARAEPAGGHCPGTPAATPLTQALTPAGTLRPGARGSFDATGYTMTTAPDGHPVFQPTGTQRTVSSGNKLTVVQS